MRASRKVANWGEEEATKWRQRRRRRRRRQNKANRSRSKRTSINHKLRVKQKATSQRGQATCDTRNRTNRANRTKMQSKVWPSLSMICACLYDMKHIPHSRACNFMCAEDVDTDTDAQIRRYTFTGSCSCFTNNSQRGGCREESDGASLPPQCLSLTPQAVIGQRIETPTQQQQPVGEWKWS